MSGRYGLSAETAESIAKKLHYTSAQTNYFVDLVESLHARTKLAREQAKKRLAKQSRDLIFKELNDRELDLLSNWYYAAVLELLSINSSSTLTLIAKRLEISKDQVDEAIRVLLRLGKIEKVGEKFIVNDEFFIAYGPTPKPVIRRFHNEVMRQVSHSIESTPVDARKNLSAIFSIDSSKVESARTWLDEMNKEFFKKFCSDGNKNTVMAFGLHLVQIAEGISND